MESNLQTSARVRLQHRYGDSFPVHQGVGQGKIISTHNYKVYINDLLLLLEASGCGLSISANYLGSPTCADDVVLLANTVIDLQTQMDIVYSYSTDERYHIHPDKSKFITFGMKFPPSVKLNDKEVIPTESLTHLGIDRYANDPSPDASIDDRLSLGRRSAYELMGSGFHGMNGIFPAISIHIYRTYVLPRVLYGLEGTILKSKHIQTRALPQEDFKAATDVTRSYGYMCSVSTRWYTTPGGLFGRPYSYLALHGWSRHGLVPNSHGALPDVK